MWSIVLPVQPLLASDLDAAHLALAVRVSTLLRDLNGSIVHRRKRLAIEQSLRRSPRGARRARHGSRIDESSGRLQRSAR
jgi:hypothetical protein